MNQIDEQTQMEQAANNKEASIQVKGLETFRRTVVLTSLVFSVVSILILIFANHESCNDGDSNTGQKMQDALWICLAVQVTIFFLLLMHYIHCGHCIRKIGKWMGLFYFALTVCMCYAQVLFFNASSCNHSQPTLYYWLLINIACFYVFIAYGISLWGAYICWAQEEEEVLVKKAIEYRRQTLIANGQMAMLEQQTVQQEMLMGQNKTLAIEA